MPGTSSRTRVVAITGGKGGVGKSTIAANLAVAFASRRAQVLVLDGDMGMADLNLLFGVAPARSIVDILEGERAENVLVEVHGVHLLPACNASSRLANLSHWERQSLLEAVDTLSDRFDTLIVDCAAGIGSNSVAFAAAAIDIIVVVTADPTSLADAYASVKVLSREHQVKRLYVLPNAVRTPQEADLVVERLTKLTSRFLDVVLTPLPYVPFDPLLRSAGASGIPLVRSTPDSPACRALNQVAKRLDSDSFGENRSGSIHLFWRRALDGHREAAAPNVASLPGGGSRGSLDDKDKGVDRS
ncbi:MAG: P-loop NTPase [Pseudomonadota bacterium]